MSRSHVVLPEANDRPMRHCEAPGSGAPVEQCSPHQMCSRQTFPLNSGPNQSMKTGLFSLTLTTGNYETFTLFGATNTPPRGIQRVLIVKIQVNRQRVLGNKQSLVLPITSPFKTFFKLTMGIQATPIPVLPHPLSLQTGKFH